MKELILSSGCHTNDSAQVCLLEACSLPPGELPRKGMNRTDHPLDVCYIRAAFGRALNDSYGSGKAADAERTEDLLPLVSALRGTAARKDSDAVLFTLLNQSLHDWYPRSLEAWALVLRAAECNEAAKLYEELAGALRELPPITTRAARAARAAPALREIRREMAAALLATCVVKEEVAA